VVPLPNFLVIGAGRSGTTSLDRYLRQHPDVFLPRSKAPSYFFCHDLGRIDDTSLRLVTRNYFVPRLRDYEALFEGAKPGQAIGEVSPVYLASVRPAESIRRLIPAARLIAVLRNPVDRVWARFVARTRDGLERRTLEEILATELAQPLIRDDAFGTYLAAGFCSRFLASYVDRFPPEQLRLVLFEELRNDPARVMAEIFEFLGVDATVEVDHGVRHNASRGVISNPVARAIWTRTAIPRAVVRRHLPLAVRERVFAAFTRNVEPLTLEPELRDRLRDLYRDEIESLGALLGRDLSQWDA
jgi:hypothetical protein